MQSSIKQFLSNIIGFSTIISNLNQQCRVLKTKNQHYKLLISEEQQKQQQLHRITELLTAYTREVYQSSPISAIEKYISNNKNQQQPIEVRIQLPNLEWMLQYMNEITVENLNSILLMKSQHLIEMNNRNKHKEKYLKKLEKLDDKLNQLTNDYHKRTHN